MSADDDRPVPLDRRRPGRWRWCCWPPPGAGTPAAPSRRADHGRGGRSWSAPCSPRVHHAEVVAHRVGEPFGSLVLAVAVTVIEVALIVTLMVVDRQGHLRAGPRHRLRGRDDQRSTASSASSLLVGALKHHLANFNPEGTGSALATVITLASADPGAAALHDVASPGRSSPAPQLAFAADRLARAVRCMFVFTQTVRHRDFFLPVETGDGTGGRGRRRPRRPAHRPRGADQPRAAASSRWSRWSA